MLSDYCFVAGIILLFTHLKTLPIGVILIGIAVLLKVKKKKSQKFDDLTY